jgi:ankyrin repeat protein
LPDQKALDALLISAITEGDAARVSRLLDQGASPNAVDNLTYPNVPAWYRDTPALYTACKMQRADIVALLLGRGADPNAMLSAYENMLHEEIPSLFMAFPSVPIVELLLEAGADPNKPRWQREDAGWERFPLREAPSEELKALLRRYGARE